MSMMGQLLEIKPELLNRLKENPSLTEAVIAGDATPSADDLPPMMKHLPPKQQRLMRAALSADVDTMMKLLPEKQREIAKARYSTPDQLSRRAAELKDTLKELATHARQKTGGQLIPAAELGERLSLDKAWHGLHYLLCSTADRVQEPPCIAILGGTEIGGDLGYGPARYLEVSQVATVASALSDLTKETLKQRYSPVAMNTAGIYPGHWDNPDNNDNLDWLLDAFDDLLTFYQRVAARGSAVILYLN
jgi:Domain of unknown function (DUF1877)